MKLRALLLFLGGMGGGVMVAHLAIKFEADATVSKELANVSYVASRVTDFARHNEGQLPENLASLFPHWMNLGADDTSMVQYIPGATQVRDLASVPSDLYRYGFIKNKHVAIVFQRPDSNPNRAFVWQPMAFEDQKWVQKGMPQHGDFSDLSQAVGIVHNETGVSP